MAAADITADAAGAPRKGGKKLLIIIVALVLLLAAAGGAAAWFLLRGDASGEAPAKKVASVFLPLDQFTVNLADGGGERFAQVAMTLEIAGQHAEEQIKQSMPIVRNDILLLLSSKSSKELLTVEGKQTLADQVAVIGGKVTGWKPPRAGAGKGDDNRSEGAGEASDDDRPPSGSNPVRQVHFSHFIVQ